MTSLDSEQLLQSLQTGFISKTFHSVNELAPTLLVNDYRKEKKILSSIVEELETCEAFDFSVAFINHEGLATIKQNLDEIAQYSLAHPENPKKGRILTTNYLNFTQPSALKELMQFPNIEIRAYTKGGFHPKGYIFKQSNYYSMIIGSANLTASALTMNQEWSVKFLSCTDGQIVSTVQNEFENVWNDADVVNDEWLENYSSKYDEKKLALKLVRKQIKELRKQEGNTTKDQSPTPVLPAFSEDLQETQFEQFTEAPSEFEYEEDDVIEIVPNSMQKEAMAALNNLREENQTRALLIAATGTGKTYLSIFDVNQMKPNKVLYVAHRDMILDKAEKSFKTFFPSIKTGFLNGNRKDMKADYLFASVFTLAKDDILKQFARNEFDYIIVDEVHHAGADSYIKVIDYFEPKFLLGLTATPERNDGFDIYKKFDYNIAYEIRLQKAMEEDLLCPFHYYGLTDLTINGEVIDDKADFKKLVCEERIKHIERSINLYRNFSYPVKGLIFCSGVYEAQELSIKLNNDGYHTKYLTGEDSDIKREQVIQELESDDDPLQYIISVNIFNEGVDIPSVNQIVMLRPTESAIIFVQQLGRGLRKYKGKSYVSVIDFIGNYTNNFFIPIALYGNNSYNKDNLRKIMTTGSAGLPGTSTVQITEIARKRIFESINKVNFIRVSFLKNEYKKLKDRLGHIPLMMDFVSNGFIDPMLFIDCKNSFYNFKNDIGEDVPNLPELEKKSLIFFSLEFATGFRLHELLLINYLLYNQEISIQSFSNLLTNYELKLNKKDLKGIENLLSPNFYTVTANSKYGNLKYITISSDGYINRTEEFNRLLENVNYKSELEDIIKYGLQRGTLKENEIREDNSFILYRKYSRKEVCKLLNWESNLDSVINGYRMINNGDSYECPIFVTYKKDANISESTKYIDRFIDTDRFIWKSQSKISSKTTEEQNKYKTVQPIIFQKKKIYIPLFVKKSDGEGSDFYYLGRMKYVSFEDTKMENTDDCVVTIVFDMEKPIPQNLYDYLEA